MSGTVTDISQLPGLPPGAPLAVTDLVFVGRPLGSGQSAAYAVPAALLAQQLASLAQSTVQVTASGTDQPSAAALAAGACNVIVGGTANGGLRIPSGVNTCGAFNTTTTAWPLYPPQTLNQAGTGYLPTSINSQAPGLPVTVPAGVKVECRTTDGVNFYVG